MGEYVVAIWLAILVPVVLIPTAVVILRRFRFYRRSEAVESGSCLFESESNELNCRVRVTKQKKEESVYDAFIVEFLGTIHAPSDMHYAGLQIFINDITDGVGEAKAVQSRLKQWQIGDSPDFCYRADLGKLPGKDMTLSNWTRVAEVKGDWLLFARKGERQLQLDARVVSLQGEQELACAKCSFSYENSAFGYIDLQENIQRTRTLAVALGFAVSAVDDNLIDCEIDVIKSWAMSNIDLADASKRARRKLEKALNKTVVFFRGGNRLDIGRICEEIVEISPLANRYGVLELCLHVVRAKGAACSAELDILKQLAQWLEVDMDRFRGMVEKILPVNMHEVEDPEFILGVTSDMNQDQKRRQLTREYRKWHARVTNFDPEVQSQADYMLNFIAEARSAYVG